MFTPIRTLGALALVIFLTACQTPAPDGGTDPRPPQPQGRTCAGIAALRCGPGDYCNIPEGQCRTVADAGGICTAKPQICTMIYAPVCGCDGKTYSSSCTAAAAGTSVASRGACKP